MIFDYAVHLDFSWEPVDGRWMKEIDHALKPNFTDCATSNYFIIFSPVKAAVVSEALTQWQSDGAFFRQQCMVILKRCKLSWVEGEYRGNSNTTENRHGRSRSNITGHSSEMWAFQNVEISIGQRSKSIFAYGKKQRLLHYFLTLGLLYLQMRFMLQSATIIGMSGFVDTYSATYQTLMITVSNDGKRVLSTTVEYDLLECIDIFLNRGSEIDFVVEGESVLDEAVRLGLVRSLIF